MKRGKAVGSDFIANSFCPLDLASAFFTLFLPILLSFIKQLGKENGEVGVSIFIYYSFALYILYFSSKNRYRSACRASKGIGNCSVHLCPGRWG